VYKRPTCQYWYASYTDSGGRRVRCSTGTASKTEAVKVRAKWVADIWNQDVRGIQPDQWFARVMALYLKGTAKVKRSSGTDMQRVKALREFFKDGLLMKSLCSQDVRNYIADRHAKGITNKSVNKELSLLSSAIKFVNSEYDWSLPNPVQGKRLKEEEVEARCLSVEEARKLLAAASIDLDDNQNKYTKDYFPDLLILGFNSFMRSGEMLKLKWSRVGFARNVIKLKAVDTKNGKPRKVPLNGTAKAALVRLRKLCDDNFPDTPYVFTHTKPRYFGTRIKSISKVFAIAVERAGIPHATPHCLRHTSITEAVHADGANIGDIAKQAGQSLKTAEGYTHTADERLHKAVAGLENIVTF
jgi:integrase